MDKDTKSKQEIVLISEAQLALMWGRDTSKNSSRTAAKQDMVGIARIIQETAYLASFLGRVLPPVYVA